MRFFGETIEEVSKRLSATDTAISAAVVALRNDMEALRATIPKEQVARLSSDEKSRLDEVEARTAKLWVLLTEESAAGRPKLSTFGRSIRSRMRR